ncbi:LytTR family DNA-binding domain-containing protein [uncultured Bacteroides sp.]|uniref:LytR/AlgR family response regulator transcription factor n=2 Tax=Bacteroides TaxID=816 RepID=UPI002602EADE|nr:LytTR family DNA-binding domain-containing protein [uncultured Bacteroides sp.]
MKNITCIAIDDEPMALLVIEQFCRRKGGITLRTFSEPQIGLEAIRKQKPELVFLDIQMHSVNGLEIADTLPRECIFIFTTAYAEYALDGFNLDAVDFLHKPFSYERFEIAVGKALRRINTFTTVVPESIVVKQEYNNVNILLSDILYVEALGNYVKIMRRSGGHVLTRNNLKSIYNLLPSDRFLRIHRSYIIALDVVLSYSHTKITLKGDISLPIGIQYASFVAKRLGE